MSEQPPKRVREDTDDEDEGTGETVPKEVLCRKKLMKGIKRVRKGLCSPGQSLSLVHAGVASVLALLMQVRSTESPELRSLPYDDQRLCYLRAIASGESLLKVTGFRKDKVNKVWAFELEALDSLPVVVDVLQDVLASLAEEIAHYDKSTDPTIAEKDLVALPNADMHRLGTKVIGCYLGGILGDVLGGPISTWDKDVVTRWFQKVYEVHGLLPPREAREGTDEKEWLSMDFQQLLGSYSAQIALQLHLTRSILQAHGTVAKDFLVTANRTLKSERPRAYLHSARQLLRTTSDLGVADKSCVSAALVVPLALAFRHQADSTTLQSIREVLQPFARRLDAIGCNYIMCQAIQYLLPRDATAEPLDTEAFLQHLLGRIQQHRLSDVLTLRIQTLLCEVRGVAQSEQPGQPTSGIVDVLEVLCTALQIFVRHCATPVTAMVEAINCGFQPSNTGLIVGTLLGALHGYRWIPTTWFESLGNGTDKKDDPRCAIVHLANELAAFCLDAE